MEGLRNRESVIAEKLSDEKTLTALENLLERVVELHDTGVLDSLSETMQAVTFLKQSFTDSMVSKNASMGSDLMEIAAEAASPELLESLRELKKVHRSGKLKDLFEISDNVSFIMNTITEKMLERNAEMTAELYNILSVSADPSVAEALKELKELQRSGNLRTLVEASYMLSFLSTVVSDSMVQRIASFLADFVEEVSTPQIKDIMSGMSRCMTKTIREFSTSPPQPGVKNLLRLFRDREVQTGMMFMSHLAKNMHQCVIQGYAQR